MVVPKEAGIEKDTGQGIGGERERESERECE